MSPPYIPGFCWNQFLEVFPKNDSNLIHDKFKNTYIYMEMLDSFTHYRIYNTYLKLFKHNVPSNSSYFIDYTNSIKMLVDIYNNF